LTHFDKSKKLTHVDFDKMKSRTQAKFAVQAKKRLIDLGKTVTELAAEIDPPRPRSTISVAIHTTRFPKVRKQVREALGI